jgi:hypothetical protein
MRKMRRKTTAALIVSLLILLAAVAAIFSLYGSSQGYSGVTRRATGYLVANYNPSIGMIPETQKGSTYFVYSDNFLAAYVLGRSVNSTFRAIAANITSTDERYLSTVPDPVNQYQVISSSNGSFFASNNYALARVGSSVIETTLNNGTSTLSPSSYADIAFLEALYWHQVRGGYVFNEFMLGVHLYDGRGFVDKASSGGVYQTYELALYDYVGKIVGATLPPGLDANLARLQASDGGFYTGYTSDFSPIGSTNTETTSLAILALSTPAAKTAQPYSFYLPLFISAIAAVVLAEVVVVRRRSRKREKAPQSPARFHRDSIASIEV